MSQEDEMLNQTNKNSHQYSDQNYRRWIESLPAIIYSFSDRKDGIYYSKGVEKILGYGVNVLTGIIIVIIHPALNIGKMIRGDGWKTLGAVSKKT